MCNLNFSIKKAYYSLPISQQVFVGVLAIVLMNVICTTLTITLIVFLLSNSAFKDIINILDNQEFSQMSYFGIATEYTNVYYSEFFKIYTTELTNFRYYLGKLGNIGLIDSNYLNSRFPNFLIHSDMLQMLDGDNSPKMAYFSKKYSMEELNNDLAFQMELHKINSMVLMIQMSQKFYVFPNSESFDKNSIFPFFEKIVMVDYEREVVFVYPHEDQLKINKNLDFKDLLKYVESHYISMNRLINYLGTDDATKFMNNNKNFNNTIRYLPLFLEKDIYDKFFDSSGNAVSNQINTFATSNIYKNRLEVTDENYLEKINSNIFLLSRNSISDLTYDTLAFKTGGVHIILTDYRYPYEIYTVYECQNFFYVGNNFQISAVKDFKTLAQCFNGKSNLNINDIPPNSKNSDYEKFTYDYDLYEQSQVFPVSESTLYLLNKFEDNKLLNYLKILTKGVNLRLFIYNNRYKTRKTYFPLTSYDIFQYFYPITNIKLSLIFKNEAKFIGNKYNFFLQNIGNFLMSFVGSLIMTYIVVGAVMYFLSKAMAFIDKPLNIIDDALKTISDQDKFTKSKVDLENYIYDENYNSVIDEFVDLITIILEMIEGNMNLKQEPTHNEHLKLKMVKEEINKDIAMVKLNNIIVMENIILEKLENDNFFYEILKISLENDILQDKNVKKCDNFVSLVKNHINKAKKSKLEKLRMTNLIHFEDFEPFVLPTFNFNKIYKNEAKMMYQKKLSMAEVNSNNLTMNNANKDYQRKKSIIRIPDEISSSITSDDSENEGANKDDRYDPIKQKKKIKKMMNIKDNYFLGKMKNSKNPLYPAYGKMKVELRKPKNRQSPHKNLITI